MRLLRRCSAREALSADEVAGLNCALAVVVAEEGYLEEAARLAGEVR